ncbi:MAG: hypothetical protein AAF351_11630 [Pseudomonadota bacterium]
MKNFIRQFVIASVVVLVAGCGSAVTLEPVTIPRPLIDPIPATVGLRMPENFHHYVHEEEVLGSEEWSINLGAANAELFTQLYGHMFDRVVLLSDDDNPDEHDLDALIEPAIEAFEFSVPNQSKTKSFAVWIRYRITVYDNNGDVVADWPVSAYGKSQKESVSGPKALQRAAVLAMRDAAALMIMKLDQAAGISGLAADRRGETTPPDTETDTQLESEPEAQTSQLGATAGDEN